MKRGLTFLLSLLICSAIAFATNESKYGWVYLNNGSIVNGEVTKSGNTVTIVTPKGDTLSYPAVEVNKISYRRPTEPKVNKDNTLSDYADSNSGFWMRGRLTGSSSLFLKEKCTFVGDLDIAGGYMFCQYLKAGIGFGARYYVDNSRIRESSIKWSFPIFATATGNIIDDTYRTVVPYYSVDLGGAIRDGFMFRPTLGIRVGQQRSAFLLEITYTGQCLRYKTDKNRYVSMLGLSLGYEF